MKNRRMPWHDPSGQFYWMTFLLCCPPSLLAQHVGIGEPFPQTKLHVNGSIRVDGDSILGDADAPATILHLVANGGISCKLDANNDGNERFTVKKGGPDPGSVVFEVSEAGNTTATGFGDFNGYGRFNGNLTLSGDSRILQTGENFDVVGDGSVEFYLDADGDNASADFGIRNDVGDLLFLLEEDRNPTIYPFGATTGQTGGLRLRELAAGGSNFIGLRSADALSGNIWLTLPTTDGLPGQFLQTDGTGILSWAYPPALRSSTADDRERPSGPPDGEWVRITVDSGEIIRTGIPGGGWCVLSGMEVQSQESLTSEHRCEINRDRMDDSYVEESGGWFAVTTSTGHAIQRKPLERSVATRIEAACKGTCLRLQCTWMCYR